MGLTRAYDVAREGEGEECHDPGGEGHCEHVTITEDGAVVYDTNAGSWRCNVSSNMNSSEGKDRPRVATTRRAATATAHRRFQTT
jgi:hypothetical protein